MISHILKLIWNKKSNNSLLIIEIFLSFLVLFAVLSYVIYNTDRLSITTGFETENRWLIYLDRNNDGMDSTAIAEMKTTLKRELRAMPNIEAVSFTNGVGPYSNNTWQSSSDDMGFEIFSRYVYADEDFEETMGINVIEGRWFEEDDVNATYEPMIVNEFFMNEYFPDKSMVDSIILFDGDKRVVGVIDDYRYNGIFEEPVSTSFFLQPHTAERASIVYLKLSPNTPKTFEEEVSKTVESITKSSSFVIQDLSAMERRNSRETWIPMIALLSISGFLCINVALGLFGVLWYNINNRRSEIGLRRALGASRQSIASQFTGEVLMLTVLAVLVGIFFAVQVPLLKLIDIPPVIFYRSMLYSALIILTIVVICALYPSAQASRIQPATALHED
ncbi:ABC transporter permease [Portibacter marinus]|uniref:ABC transporter permease n=1 Tax=Portibacter marinus TaxID=2898660 RepID=UPI001F3B80DB|nr:FtsX-like permease family protein [Portibacter marinus]